MNILPDILMLASLVVLGYAWIGYPVVLAAVASVRKRPVAPHAPTPAIACVDFILSAHNEERCIADRLDNLIAAMAGLEAKGIRARTFVGLDGCTDRTAEIARERAAGCGAVILCAYCENRGKVAVLKDLVRASADGGRAADGVRLIAFTDANTRFAPDAIEKMLPYFADPAVGGVCGRLVFEKAGGSPESHQAAPGGQAPETRYWMWETGLKERESTLDSCLGANGAIYAIRRELFPADIPENTVVDDFVIGMKVREQGFRMIYDSSAVAYETLPAKVVHEWGRRVRIGAGDFQALFLCRRCLMPRFGVFAWIFWSHKVLRWFTPIVGIMLLMSAALALASHRIAAPGALTAGFILAAGAFLGLLAAVGFVFPESRFPGAGVVALARYFVVIQAALFAGFLRFCRGGLQGRWERTPR